MSDDEVKGTDYLAKEVMLTPGKKMGRIGFIHHKAQAGAKAPDKPKQSDGRSRAVSSSQRNSPKRPKA
jgi:hypothetical protein